MRGLKVFLTIFLVTLLFVSGCGRTPMEPTTGTITGHAYLSGEDDHSGILIYLEKSSSSSGVPSYRISRALSPAYTASASTADAVTDAKGSYKIEGVGPGEYTIYAIKKDTQKVAYTSVKVVAGVISSADDLYLQPTGNIKGTITLKSASDYSGIVVYIPGTSFVAYTDANGNYMIYTIPVGTYDLIASKDGYQDTTIKGIQVNSSETTTVANVKLSLSSVINTTSKVDLGSSGRIVNWTSDANYIIFSQNLYKLLKINIQDGTINTLSNNFLSGISEVNKEATKVLYVNIVNAYNLVIKDLETYEEITIDTNTDYDYYCWFPSGDKVLYFTDPPGKIYTYNLLDGTKTTVVDYLPYSCYFNSNSVSPDETRFWVQGGSIELIIYTISTGDSIVVDLSSYEYNGYVENLPWTSDGNFLILFGNSKIYKISTSDGSVTEVFQIEFLNTGTNTADYYATNDLIAYVADDGIYTIKSDGTGKTKVYSGAASDIHWSPDGNYIAFKGYNSGLYILDLSNQNSVTQLSPRAY